MTEPNDDTNVIGVDFSPKAVSLVTNHYTEDHCNHFGCGTWIDAKMRSLKCRKCDVQVDPYEWISNLAHREGVEYLERQRAEVADLRQSNTALRAEEKRIKARLKRAKKSLVSVFADDPTAKVVARLVKASPHGPGAEATSAALVLYEMGLIDTWALARTLHIKEGTLRVILNTEAKS